MSSTVPKLAHYTTRTALLSILKNGSFRFLHNDRGLIQRFTGDFDWSEMPEPQPYGMVSFTELSIGEAQTHRKRFGPYGIVMRKEWLLEEYAQPVIYVPDSGPIHEALSSLFGMGLMELYERFAEDAGTPKSLARLGFAPINKRAAATFLRSPFWAHLLTLYEYMQPIRDRDQREWRIVQPLPVAFQDLEKEAQQRAAARDATTWGLRQLRFDPCDVAELIVPADNRAAFAGCLPEGFTETPLRSHRQLGNE